MEMCYDGALVMPSSYAVMNEDEMTYVEGGWSWWQKALVGVAIVAAGVGLVVALSYGQIWLASRIMKSTFRAAVNQLGIKAVATIVGGSLAVSSGLVATVLNSVF